MLIFLTNRIIIFEKDIFFACGRMGGRYNFNANNVMSSSCRYPFCQESMAEVMASRCSAKGRGAMLPIRLNNCFTEKFL